MASAEHELITGVWGTAPSGVQGQSPMSRGQLGRFCNYSNFRLCLILWLLLGPRVARCGEAANVKTAPRVLRGPCTERLQLLSESAGSQY